MSVDIASSELEQEILAVLQLRDRIDGAPPLPEDMVNRIRVIRDACLAADKQDILPNGGVVGWRKGLNNQGNQYHKGGGGGYRSGHGGGGHGGGGHGGGHGHGGGGGHVWRGGNGVATGANSAPRGPRPQPTGERPAMGGSPRYVSKFQNNDTPVEDKILNQVILNKLNKFSASNYDEVKAFLQQILDSDEKEFLRDFMLLVFKKAAGEPTFCPLYARMISELSADYKSLLGELETLYTRYLTIFEEVTEGECKDYEHFVQRNREKLHRLGYSQFLAELTSRGVLTQSQIQQLFSTILQQIKSSSAEGTSKQQLVEEYSDCLMRMSKAFQGTKNAGLLEICRGLGEHCDPCITDILANRSSQYPGLSKKAQFTLMDCLDIFRAAK